MSLPLTKSIQPSSIGSAARAEARIAGTGNPIVQDANHRLRLIIVSSFDWDFSVKSLGCP
jgi:hypothetical protein